MSLFASSEVGCLWCKTLAKVFISKGPAERLLEHFVSLEVTRGGRLFSALHLVAVG